MPSAVCEYFFSKDRISIFISTRHLGGPWVCMLLMLKTFVFAILLGFWSPLAMATAIVQSVPTETDLAHPNLPFAKDVWLEMIGSAKKTIDIAEFYASS